MQIMHFAAPSFGFVNKNRAFERILSASLYTKGSKNGPFYATPAGSSFCCLVSLILVH